MKLIYNLQKYSGITGITIIWFCISLGMHRTGLELLDNRPISYLGTDSRSAFLFTFGLSLSALLFISFGLYLKTIFKVSNTFLLVYLFGMSGQIVAAFVPYGRQNRYGYIHTTAAFALAYSLPIFLWLFARSQRKSSYKKLYQNLFRFELICFVVGIGLFVFTKGLAPLGESLPAIGFHLWIIAITITSSKVN